MKLHTEKATRLFVDFACIYFFTNIAFSVVPGYDYRYTVDELTSSQFYSLGMVLTVCLDGSCTDVPVFSNALVPIPLCNGTASLPGGGTLDGYLEMIANAAGEDGIMMLLKHFNLAVGIA